MPSPELAHIMYLSVVCVRVLMGVLSESWYVPDETWQSVEVAHRLVFGTGFNFYAYCISEVNLFVNLFI